MIIDFHTHLDFYKREELQKQLTEFSGIIIAASVDEKSFLENCAIAEWTKKSARNCHIIPTFGIHPNAADENAALLDDPTTATRLAAYLDHSPLIGEIGMDFCWSKCSKENQEKVFRWFLEYCNRKGKACVIHTKDAEQEICNILTDYPKARPIIHWYDGPENIFREFIRRGYPQTFGVETIRSPHLQNLLRLTPPELLLAETDNPDSEPWLGGTRSDVALIERVYEEIAGLLGMSRPVLEKIIEENFKRIISN
ncbi:TatD family hydrolase [Treponema bryantii]|uniref:TatD family hydrolase n=1 Tax=Treponema bryantii TaxID=163 RepID=UPI0003B3C0FA|nr:TatD family hydrolase [Treponema bryantii]